MQLDVVNINIADLVVPVDYLPCASNPCRNGGICLKHGKCECKDEYSGPTCERKSCFLSYESCSYYFTIGVMNKNNLKNQNRTPLKHIKYSVNNNNNVPYVYNRLPSLTKDVLWNTCQSVPTHIE